MRLLSFFYHFQPYQNQFPLRFVLITKGLWYAMLLWIIVIVVGPLTIITFPCISCYSRFNLKTKGLGITGTCDLLRDCFYHSSTIIINHSYTSFPLWCVLNTKGLRYSRLLWTGVSVVGHFITITFPYVSHFWDLI